MQDMSWIFFIFFNFMQAAVLPHSSSPKEVSALFCFCFFPAAAVFLGSLLSNAVARDTWPTEGKREPELARPLTEL